MFTTYGNPTRYDVRLDLAPPNTYCIVNLLVLRTTWRWPTYMAETCSCLLRSIAYYIVIPSDIVLCFWLHVYVNIHIIIYIVLLKIRKSNHERGIAQHSAAHATVNQQTRTRLVECCWSLCASARSVLL